MAAQQDLVSAVVVLGILLAVMALNQVLAKRAAAAPRPPPGAPLGPDSVLGRYATHRGSVVGEVVAITTDRLVLRQGGVHRAVPLSQARLSGGDVALEGDIDWAAAEEAGRSWAGPPPPGPEAP